MRFRRIAISFITVSLLLLLTLYDSSQTASTQKMVEAFHSTSETMLIPSGQLIGVKLNTKGIFVVGFSDIETVHFIKQSPALKNGLQIGDCIQDVDGTKLESSMQLAEIIRNSKGHKLCFSIRRKSKIMSIQVKPMMSAFDNAYKTGMWVRDSTQGVGTLTFIEPKTFRYGALGHSINDLDTGMLLPALNGQIYEAKVVSISGGEKGRPGELTGRFSHNTQLGDLSTNTMEGIFGTIDKRQEKVYSYREPIPIAMQSEVKLGPAKIIASIDKKPPRCYDIVIEKLTKQSVPDSKGIVVRITDKELLQKTGGIVQGMSGCPILQNNRLVGAITHVLVNKPELGYGIYIEWMLKQIDKMK